LGTKPTLNLKGITVCQKLLLVSRAGPRPLGTQPPSPPPLFLPGSQQTAPSTLAVRSLLPFPCPCDVPISSITLHIFETEPLPEIRPYAAIRAAVAQLRRTRGPGHGRAERKRPSAPSCTCVHSQSAAWHRRKQSPVGRVVCCVRAVFCFVRC
jgi:hypothetical protein